MKKDIKPLEPIDVSGLGAVVVKNGRHEKLKGFHVTVTYSATADVLTKRNWCAPKQPGARFGSMTYCNGQLEVDYIFKKGLFLPEPMERANKFRTLTSNIIAEKHKVGMYIG